MRTTLGAFVALLAAVAHAQQAQRIEKIEVTGTNIKRLDTETVAPVEVITREEIVRSGRATAAEVIRNIPANTGGSFDETFTNSFAPGTAGVSLRGLGQRATLVLLNGRRTAGYGHAQNLQDTFVDLNSIPASAIERIEILKDGASAIYGSDAIAGVVNIILRREFRGTEASVRAGYYDGKDDLHLSASSGFGDLGRDRISAFGTFDYYRRDLLTQADSRFGGTGRDFRGQQGGRNHQYSLTGGGTWRQLSPAGALTNVTRAITECPGLVLTAAEAVELGLIHALAGNAALNQPGNTFCAYDFAGQFALFPRTERLGFLGRVSYAISPAMTAYADLGLSRVTTFQNFQAGFFAGAGHLEQTPSGARRSTFNINFAPGVAGNPFSTNARYMGVLHDVGTRGVEVVSDTVRVLAGVDFGLGGWELDSAIGWSRNQVDFDALNQISRAGVGTVFNVPTSIQPPIPLSQSSSYNLDRFTTNSEEIRNLLRTNERTRRATSELRFVDTRASTAFGNLAGGPIGVAVGAELRHERRDDALRPSDDILGNTARTSTGDARDSLAMFGELGLPFFRQVEGQVAARYDHYSDYGSSFTPKVGVKVKPAPWLLVRANWGKGFRAPNLVEISPSTSTFFTSVFDPVRNAFANVFGALEGNPGLEPEKSTNATLGIIWEPTADASIGVGHYSIRWKNLIGGNLQAVVDAGDPARVIRDPDTNAILGVIGQWLNRGETRTSGMDVDARYRLRTPAGRLTARANFSYLDSWKQGGVEYAGTDGNGLGSLPRVRGYTTLDWDWQALTSTVRYNYMRGVRVSASPSFFQEQDPRFQHGVLPRRTASYATWDFHFAYQVTRTLALSVSIINAFDKAPPYQPSLGGWDFSQFDPRRTQYRVGATWKP